MKQYTLGYSFVCNNKWDNMTPKHNGRYCGDCNKVVVDFTQMKDSEIIEYLLKNKHTCGILKKNQVNRPMFLFAYKKRSSWPAMAAMLIAGLVTLAPINIQANNINKTNTEFFPIDGKKGEPQNNEQKITVFIFNSATNQPIPKGMVYVDGIGYFYSDENGKTEIIINWTEDKRPEHYYITVSANGYMVKNYQLKEKELKTIFKANVYLDVYTISDDDIMPAGAISIQEVDTQNKK